MGNNIIGLNPVASNGATSLVTGVLTQVGAFNPNTPFVVDLQSAYTSASMTTVVTGGPASTTIQLQGSFDGSNWTTIATSISTTGDVQFAAAGSAFSTLRVNVSAVSGGTAPTVAVAIAAYGAEGGGAVAATQPVSGTVTANQGTKNASLAQAWPVSLTDGTNGPAAVKAASTAAVAADASVVAAISPNSNVIKVASGAAAQLNTTAGNPSNVLPAVAVSGAQTLAFLSLSAATGTGAGSVLDMGCATNNVVLALNGTSTSVQVNLEGSLDNATFFALTVDAAATVVTARAVVSTGKPVRYVRGNVVTIANGNVTANVMGCV